MNFKNSSSAKLFTQNATVWMAQIKTDGFFTIVSTNDITKIDEALGIPEFIDIEKHNFISSRPGRIESVIELGYINNENKMKMAHKILFEFPDKLEEVMQYILKEIQETPAQFQEYCSQIALEEYWKMQSEPIQHKIETVFSSQMNPYPKSNDENKLLKSV